MRLSKAPKFAAYHIRCFYSEMEKTVQSNFDVSGIPNRRPGVRHGDAQLRVYRQVRLSSFRHFSYADASQVGVIYPNRVLNVTSKKTKMVFGSQFLKQV